MPSPSPGDLPNPGIEPRSPALQADALPSEPPGKPMVLLVAHGLSLIVMSGLISVLLIGQASSICFRHFMLTTTLQER